MALFRPNISKQRVLLSRISSLSVYYVHSHLQYTLASCSQEQVRQRLQTLPSSEFIKSELTLLPVKSNQLLLKEKKQHGNHIKRNGINSSLSPHTALLNVSSPTDSLTTRTQLALLSLSYDDKWSKQLNTVYCNAMKSRELLGYISCDYTIDEMTSKFHKERISPRLYRIKDNNGLYRHTIEENVLMCSDMNQVAAKEKDIKRKDDKCDPLLLAMVYQSLRDELPVFFQKGHGYDLYHKNVKFINGLINTTFSGLRMYKCAMTSMRLAAQTCMSDITMEILKITKDKQECNVKVRWRVSGIPRYTSLIANSKDDKCRYVDGFSIFDVDVDGLIYCHRLLKLMPSQSPAIKDDNPLWALNTTAVLALLRQQKSYEMLARHRVEDVEETCLLL